MDSENIAGRTLKDSFGFEAKNIYLKFLAREGGVWNCLPSKRATEGTAHRLSPFGKHCFPAL